MPKPLQPVSQVELQNPTFTSPHFIQATESLPCSLLHHPFHELQLCRGNLAVVPGHDAGYAENGYGIRFTAETVAAAKILASGGVSLNQFMVDLQSSCVVLLRGDCNLQMPASHGFSYDAAEQLECPDIIRLLREASLLERNHPAIREEPLGVMI